VRVRSRPASQLVTGDRSVVTDQRYVVGGVEIASVWTSTHILTGPSGRRMCATRADRTEPQSGGDMRREPSRRLDAF
jgi:hypothetical protein